MDMYFDAVLNLLVFKAVKPPKSLIKQIPNCEQFSLNKKPLTASMEGVQP